jgi:hypothetical protein
MWIVDVQKIIVCQGAVSQFSVDLTVFDHPRLDFDILQNNAELEDYSTQRRYTAIIIVQLS